MFILIESPFCVACDSPADYKDQQGQYLLGMDFLKGLPTVWDETRGLAGEVGQYVVEVRRHGQSWYLAAITDRSARDILVKLDFLSLGSWTLKLWKDAPDSDTVGEHLVTEQRTVTPGDILALHLARAGGAVAYFEPVSR
jgi:alpha-glucosidase